MMARVFESLRYFWFTIASLATYFRLVLKAFCANTDDATFFIADVIIFLLANTMATV